MLRALVSQEIARQRIRARAQSLHVVVVQDGNGDSREALREHHVTSRRLDDRPLVIRMRMALHGGDEAGAALYAGISQVERATESERVANTASTHDRHAKIRQLLVQLLGGLATGVTAGARVHGDETVHATVEAFRGPF